MNKTKLEKGITLIALIITIVVLLIIAVVTIGAIQKSKIITHAQKASDDYTSEKEKEEGIISDYESYIESNIPGGSGIGKATVGVKVSKNSTIDGKEYSSTNPVIPAGFKAINITTEGHESYWNAKNGPEVVEGLVISDGVNEFVWIPVSEIDEFATIKEEGSTDYKSILYDLDKDISGNTYYANANEPEVISTIDKDYISSFGVTKSLDDDDDIDIDDVKKILQINFNNMVESVSKYGGFYVGRYEMSVEGGVAQSSYGKAPASAAAESANTWYGLYEKAKTYSTSNASLSVVSQMIYGCQWDAMLKFILKGTEANNVSTPSTVEHNFSKAYLTGGKNYPGTTISYNDISSNIYDLEGNVTEATQEVIDGTDRAYRSGNFWGEFYSPNWRNWLIVTDQNECDGTRLTLYVI